MFCSLSWSRSKTFLPTLVISYAATKLANPKYRYLRGYTIDPGFSTRLDTMGVNEAVYKIKWEELHPGPIGEYVEIIDFDTSS